MNSNPTAITGTPIVCTGYTTTLASTPSGGAWTSSNIAEATEGTGIVSGITAGNPTITYTLPTGCITTVVATVNATPAAIAGTMSVCVGLTTTLTSATPSGTWTSSNTSQAVVGGGTGVVTGVAAGIPVISYTMATGCYVVAPVTETLTRPLLLVQTMFVQVLQLVCQMQLLAAHGAAATAQGLPWFLVLVS